MFHPLRKLERIYANTASIEPKLVFFHFMMFYFNESEELFLRHGQISYQFDLIIKAETRRKFISSLLKSIFILFITLITLLIVFVNKFPNSLIISLLGTSLELVFTFIAHWIGKRVYIKYSVSIYIYKLIATINEVYTLKFYKDKKNEHRYKALSGKEERKEIWGELMKRLEEYSKHFDEYFKTEYYKYRYISDSSVETKKKALLNIEIAATYAERYIPILLKSGDISTDESFKYLMRQVATGLREKKIWILTPMEDTYEQLIARLVDNLIQVMNDNWHNLEHAAPSNTSRSSLMRVVVLYSLQVLKTVFLGFLILLLFLAFQLASPFPLNETLRSIWLASGFLWLGITILMKFDPDITAKFSLMKDAKSLLSGQETSSKP